jgi:hypothetical protein
MFLYGFLRTMSRSDKYLTSYGIITLEVRPLGVDHLFYTIESLPTSTLQEDTQPLCASITD